MAVFYLRSLQGGLVKIKVFDDVLGQDKIERLLGLGEVEKVSEFAFLARFLSLGLDLEIAADGVVYLHQLHAGFKMVSLLEEEVDRGDRYDFSRGVATQLSAYEVGVPKATVEEDFVPGYFVVSTSSLFVVDGGFFLRRIEFFVHQTLHGLVAFAFDNLPRHRSCCSHC